MKVRNLLALLTIGILSYATSSLTPPLAAQGQDEGVEVLARGPLHEAFAAAMTFSPQTRLTIKTAPPEAIEEMPPDQKPEGDNVAWIPGYWGWDDEREDFIWISGVWRAIPPGREWIAGYWAVADNGHQWISGYWANSELVETRYYAEPPKTLENGPSTEAPSPDHAWIPGVWMWHEGRHAWRPGYWMLPRANWIWVPSSWAWTPSGCVFVDGYWDYSVPRRGIVFAPVYLTRTVYSRPDFYFRPTLVVNPAIFVSHFFLRPAYHHCYFGDYYASNYSTIGIYPRFTYQNRYGYDPIFAYQRWEHRDDRDWVVNVQRNYERLERDETARPPRTFDRRWLEANVEGNAETNVVTSLTQITKNSTTAYSFSRVMETERRELAGNAKAIRQQRDVRLKTEAKVSADVDATVKTGTKTGIKTEPVTVKLPKSPISAARLAARAETGTSREPGTREPGTTEPRVREPGKRDPLERPETRPMRDPTDPLPRDPAPAPGEKGKGKGKGKGSSPDRTPPSREPKPRLGGDPDDAPPPSPEVDRGTTGERPPASERPKSPRPGREKPPKTEVPRASETRDLEKLKNPSKTEVPRPSETRDLEKLKNPPKTRPMPDTDPIPPRREPRGKTGASPREPKAPPPTEAAPKDPAPKAPAPKAQPSIEPDPVKPAPPERGSEPKPPKGKGNKEPKEGKEPKKDKEPKEDKEPK